MFEWGDYGDNYYDIPWETAADICGGAQSANHTHSRQQIITSFAYNLVGKLLGPLAWLMLEE